jgi:uncharacterized protein (DUF488 family)
VKPFGEQVTNRRAGNAKALQAFGMTRSTSPSMGTHYRTVRAGEDVSVFTIGYEKRSGDDLIGLLIDAGVEVLVDIREKPTSRKAEFRGPALASRCAEAGIAYEPMPDLGSTENLRNDLHENGDFQLFHKKFRAYAVKHYNEPIGRLVTLITKKTVALLCYERCHEECHRSVIADLIADQINATIIAIH